MADGTENESGFTAAQMKLLRPRMNEVSDLAIQMHQMTLRDAAQAEDAMFKLAQLYREELGLTHRVELRAATAQQAGVEPNGAAVTDCD